MIDLTEKHGEKEVFDDFYSSWRIKKKKSQMVGRSSTEGDTPAGARNHDETNAFSGARTLDAEISSGANVIQNSETTDENADYFRISNGDVYVLNDLIS